MPLALLLLLAFTPPLDADAGFVEARELYRNLEFERAVEGFERAARQGDRAPADRARLFGWIAICEAQLAKPDAARDALRRALEIDHDLVLPLDAPPKLNAMLEEVRATVPRPVEVTGVTDGQGQLAAPIEDGELTHDTVNLPGVVTASVGGAALVTAGVLSGLALLNVGAASDPAATQAVVVAARDAANAELWAAGISAGVGVALTTGGVALLLLE